MLGISASLPARPAGSIDRIHLDQAAKAVAVSIHSEDLRKFRKKGKAQNSQIGNPDVAKYPGSECNSTSQL
jgi:hypothetical protein